MQDKKFDNVEAVNELLKRADFGEDFVPTCPTLIDNYQTIFTTIEPEMKVMCSFCRIYSSLIFIIYNKSSIIIIRCLNINSYKLHYVFTINSKF